MWSMSLKITLPTADFGTMISTLWVFSLFFFGMVLGETIPAAWNRWQENTKERRSDVEEGLDNTSKMEGGPGNCTHPVSHLLRCTNSHPLILIRKQKKKPFYTVYTISCSIPMGLLYLELFLMFIILQGVAWRALTEGFLYLLSL